MSAQISLDLTAARASRDVGIARVAEAMPEDWSERAREALRLTAETRAAFIVDDVWEVGETIGLGSPPEARAMGAVMLWGQRSRLIEKTGRYQPSAQPQCNANPRQVWRSLIHEGRAA